MPLPLLPFQAVILPSSESPYRLRLSQGFNEAIFYGSGKPQTPELGQAIERLMGVVQGQAEPADDREAFVARLMALSWQLEYLVTTLTGDQTQISDHQVFLTTLNRLAGEVANVGQAQGDVPEWIRHRLRDAQFRHFQQSGLPQPVAPEVNFEPRARAQNSVWTSQPHVVAPFISPPIEPLNA